MDAQRRALVQTTYDDLAVEYAAHLSGELAGKPLDCALLDRFAEEVRGAGPVWAIERDPYEGVEHPSRRAYVFARVP